mgnify:CR=1 FL=1
MANYSLDLTVLNPQGKEFPGPTIAQIYIKTHSKDAKGMLYISPQCVSLQEIEAQCDRLVKEIESIRKKAQRQFKKG